MSRKFQETIASRSATVARAIWRASFRLGGGTSRAFRYASASRRDAAPSSILRDGATTPRLLMVSGIWPEEPLVRVSGFVSVFVKCSTYSDRFAKNLNTPRNTIDSSIMNPGANARGNTWSKIASPGMITITQSMARPVRCRSNYAERASFPVRLSRSRITFWIASTSASSKYTSPHWAHTHAGIVSRIK